MKNEIINKIVLEFENKIKYWYLSNFKILIRQKKNNWDIEEAFHYSDEYGLSEFVKNEGNDEVSEIIKKGSRTFIIFEHFRKSAPNLPARKIYMGEIIEVNSDIHIIGSCQNFLSYINEKSKFLEIIDKISCLDNFKIELKEQFSSLDCL